MRVGLHLQLFQASVAIRVTTRVVYTRLEQIISGRVLSNERFNGVVYGQLDSLGAPKRRSRTSASAIGNMYMFPQQREFHLQFGGFVIVFALLLGG